MGEWKGHKLQANRQKKQERESVKEKEREEGSRGQNWSSQALVSTQQGAHSQQPYNYIAI